MQFYMILSVIKWVWLSKGGVPYPNLTASISEATALEWMDVSAAQV